MLVLAMNFPQGEKLTQGTLWLCASIETSSLVDRSRILILWAFEPTTTLGGLTEAPERLQVELSEQSGYIF